MNNNDNSYAEETIFVGKKRKPATGTVQATKEFQNYAKSHDPEQAESFLEKDSEELKKIISYCIVEIKDATEQVEETPEYQKAKEDVKSFTDFLRDTVKPLKHTIELATFLLRERGSSFSFSTMENVKKAVNELKKLGAEISIKAS